MARPGASSHRPFAKAPRVGLPDYLALAETARFRTTQRRRRWNLARYSLIVVAFAALLNCLWTALTHPAALHMTIVVMAALMTVAAAGYVTVAARPRRSPVLVILAVLVCIDVAAVLLTIGRAQFAVVAFGDLLLLPVVVALMVQWPTRVHVGWLSLHVALTLGYVLLIPHGPAVHREAILLVLAVSTSLGVLWHALGHRARVTSFAQMERINALNRQSRRDQVRLSRLNAILAETASTDELTGLKNRLGLRLDLVSIRARIARHAEHYVLLLADLDRFKAINDEHGHVAGDGILRSVAHCLRSSTRPEDGVYRYGGEEFALLIRVETPAGASVVAERVRRNVAALALAHPDNSPHDVVTLSVGATTLGTLDLPTDDAALFGRADEALYRAKAEGRNRSEVAPDREPGSTQRGGPETRGPRVVALRSLPRSA
jgi:diguanylate cyclase (GGDEF)-like protein